MTRVVIDFRPPCAFEQAILCGRDGDGPDDRDVVRSLCRALATLPGQLEFRRDRGNPRGMFEAASAFVFVNDRAVAHVHGTSFAYLAVAAARLRDWRPALPEQTILGRAA